MPEAATPSITVCLPNYNHGAFVAEAIRSVLDQTLPPLEVIVVDDGSTDDSVKVIETFVRDHPSVRLVRKAKNSGVFDSAAIGLSEARGEFYFQLAADDRVRPQFFERAVALLQRHPKAGMCAAGFQYIGPDGAIAPREDLLTFHTHLDHAGEVTDFLDHEDVLKRLDRQPWFLSGIPNVLFRRAAFVDCGGLMGDLGLFADWYATHYVALKYGMCYAPEALCEFRIMPESYGTSIIMRPRSALEVAVKTVRLMNQHPSIFPPSFVERKRRDFTYGQLRSALVYSQTGLLKDIRDLVPPRSMRDRLFLSGMRFARNLQWLLLKVYCRGKVARPLEEVS